MLGDDQRQLTAEERRSVQDELQWSHSDAARARASGGSPRRGEALRREGGDDEDEDSWSIADGEEDDEPAAPRCDEPAAPRRGGGGAQEDDEPAAPRRGGGGAPDFKEITVVERGEDVQYQGLLSRMSGDGRWAYVRITSSIDGNPDPMCLPSVRDLKVAHYNVRPLRGRPAPAQVRGGGAAAAAAIGGGGAGAGMGTRHGEEEEDGEEEEEEEEEERRSRRTRDIERRAELMVGVVPLFKVMQWPYRLTAEKMTLISMTV